MAIILEESKNSTNWTMIVLVVFLFAFIAGGAYYLFFAPTPAIDQIASTTQKVDKELSQIKVGDSENAVTKNPIYKILRQHSVPPSNTQVGRANPFVKF